MLCSIQAQIIQTSLVTVGKFNNPPEVSGSLPQKQAQAPSPCSTNFTSKLQSTRFNVLQDIVTHQSNTFVSHNQLNVCTIPHKIHRNFNNARLLLSIIVKRACGLYLTGANLIPLKRQWF